MLEPIVLIFIIEIKLLAYTLFIIGIINSLSKVRRPVCLDALARIAEHRYCPKCEYDVFEHLPGAPCPECGAAIDVANLAMSLRSSPKFVWYMPLLIACLRTMLGLGLSIVFWNWMGHVTGDLLLLSWLCMAPMRFAEWWLILFLFRSTLFKTDRPRLVSIALLGTFITYAIEVLFVMGYCVPC